VGKTGKTSVLPLFIKIERGGGSIGGAPHWWSYLVLVGAPAAPLLHIIFDLNFLSSYLTCIPTEMSSFWSFFLFFFDLIFFRCELIICSTVV
jgi:hypothetical protein